MCWVPNPDLHACVTSTLQAELLAQPFDFWFLPVLMTVEFWSTLHAQMKTRFTSPFLFWPLGCGSSLTGFYHGSSLVHWQYKEVKTRLLPHDSDHSLAEILILSAAEVESSSNVQISLTQWKIAKDTWWSKQWPITRRVSRKAGLLLCGLYTCSRVQDATHDEGGSVPCLWIPLFANAKSELKYRQFKL